MYLKTSKTPQQLNLSAQPAKSIHGGQSKAVVSFIHMKHKQLHQRGRRRMLQRLLRRQQGRLSASRKGPFRSGKKYGNQSLKSLDRLEEERKQLAVKQLSVVEKM